MIIPRDKVFHLLAGALVALAMWALAWIAARFGIAAAMLCAGVITGAGYEIVQKITGEGTPHPLDALATISGAALVAIITDIAEHWV